MIQNRLIAFLFRLVCFIFVFLGLSTHIHIFSGKMNWGTLMYYTIQSNLLALVLFGLLTVRTGMALFEKRIGRTGFFARFEMVCVIDILLTFFVYWILLAPQAFSMNGDHALFTFDNLSVHAITPLLCVIDYIFFTESRHLKYSDVYRVLIFPLTYVGFTSVAGLLGYTYAISEADKLPVRFPYFFFDYDRIGAASILYILVLAVFFLLLSHGLYFLDKRVKKPILYPKPKNLWYKYKYRQ